VESLVRKTARLARQSTLLLCFKKADAVSLNSSLHLPKSGLGAAEAAKQDLHTLNVPVCNTLPDVHVICLSLWDFSFHNQQTSRGRRYSLLAFAALRMPIPGRNAVLGRRLGYSASVQSKYVIMGRAAPESCDSKANLLKRLQKRVLEHSRSMPLALSRTAKSFFNKQDGNITCV